MERSYNYINSSGRSWQELQATMLLRLNQMEGNPHAYWSCNDQPVWTKYKAMKNLHNGMATHFYYYDKEWGAADWSQPVDTNIRDLLIERAREIRRNNDYVRITYSGGADSHTVLTSFKDAGVAPDEIVFYTWEWGRQSFFNSNYEIDAAVIPFVHTIQEWFPTAKIYHLDFDFELIRGLRLLHPDVFGFELGTGIRSMSSAGAVAAFDQLPIGDGTITITGSDKPRLDYIKGNWYTWFTDVSALHVWGKNVEGFFQSGDPTIFIKQSHLMKDYLLSQLPTINRQSVLAFQAWNASKEIRKNINTSLGRSLPFNDNATSRKLSKRPAPGLSEGHSKAAILYRMLQRVPGGTELLDKWELIKKQFETETGYCPTVNVFSKFYNLDTGNACSVDELFPNGWNNK